MHYYLDALKKYGGFNGRARRKEYWVFTLVNGAVFLTLWALMSVTRDGTVGSVFMGLYLVFTLGMLVPGLAVTVRRLHDTNRSGAWWLLNLVPVGAFVLLVFLIQEGTRGGNPYGADPKELEAAAAAAPVRV